ncbi:FtsX-like permease family protein [Bifidobacterium sp. UTBIF-68]|uniref:FtsX-like permease family protein n=1 Tax=Bifidobacterium sp. UTBIF-68 TaxID=1465262 RepID=UPI0015E44801|nr:FtsX-like permease family protein [Bifidobacterium sp. UTBIF-68]
MRGAGLSGAFAKDMWRCWLRSWKRFVSIAVITMLGVAVLTGIYAGCRDAFLAAGRFYHQQGLHDLQVLSTYGLTDDDVAALREVEGVEVVQPERSQTVTASVKGAKKTVTMQEIGTEGLDQPYLQRGEMPDKAGEVAVTQQFLDDSGLKIGSHITVTAQQTASPIAGAMPSGTSVDDNGNSNGNTSSDTAEVEGTGKAGAAPDAATSPSTGTGIASSASDDSDASITDTEQAPQFPTELTIVGVVLDPRDLSNPAGYSSMTSFRSTSAEDYVFFAPSAGVTGNVYTAISIAVAGASAYDTFSDDYDAIVKTVADRIESQVQNEQQKTRRQRIVANAQSTLDDAKTKAMKQLDDSQKDIDGNRAELQANEKTLTDSRTQLEQNKTALTDGERQIAEGRTQIADARQRIAEGRTQIADARARLESGKAQLASARRQLDAVQAELTANRTKVEQGITQIGQGMAQIDQMLALIEQADGLLAQLDPNIDLDSPTWQAIKALLARLGITVPDVPSIGSLRQQLAAKQAELQTQRDSLAGQQAELQRTLNETIIPAQSTLDEQNRQLSAKEQETAAGEAQLNTQSAELEANATQLETQSAQLEAQAAQLAAGRQQLEEGERQLEQGERQLKDGKQRLDEAQQQLDAKRSEAESTFAQQQRRIDDVANARWYVQTRASIGGFSAFKSDISSIESIGRAFPVVFLVVAVLMSLITMTRMVEEDRGLIGTYLGLGYGGLTVSMRYLLFALLACLIGGGVGLLAGFLGIPAFLLVVIEGLYVLPGVRLEYDWLYGSAGILLFVVGVGVATALACRGEIRHAPAVLMRPKAPKAGARILLERITPVWGRLSFLGKVTARNIFRFKERLLMTVGGVAGCTALIVCGFAINDTVATIGVKQYEKIYQYDLMVVSNDDDAAAMRKRITADGKTSETLDLRVDNGTMSNSAQESETVQLMTVPEDSLAALNDMVTLRPADDGGWLGLPRFADVADWFGGSGGRGSSVTLDDSGVIVAQSAANSLGVRTGDTVTLGNGGSTRATVKVAAVTRNLIGSDVYISERLYDQKFAGDGSSRADGEAASAADGATADGAAADGAKDTDDSAASSNSDVSSSTLTWNAMLAKLKGSDADQIAYADRLGEDSAVLKAVSSAHLAESFKFDLMGAVVALIVGLAGGLALVVLFTLANTNVSERVREMATLKVLGFFDREVHSYVNREMLILTGMGVLVGLPLGRWIGGLLTAALNMPSLYFEVEVHWYSYLIAAAATFAFALLVQLFTNPVLDRIDPVSSLKSVE